MKLSITRLGMLAVMAVSLSACGSKSPKPVSELALADSALKNAETSGAREYAPIELRVAREKKTAADQAMSKENYTQARRLTEQAYVDAELARAKADVVKSGKALKEAQDNIKMIRDEAVRTSTGGQ